jgi:ssDNA-binding Zn-finger/Zn-ribbon topoisomerase 1
MVIRRGRFGEFLACSRYPDCKTTSAISLGVACPRPGCGGYLTEKRSRRGKIFVDRHFKRPSSFTKSHPQNADSEDSVNYVAYFSGM